MVQLKVITHILAGYLVRPIDHGADIVGAFALFLSHAPVRISSQQCTVQRSG